MKNITILTITICVLLVAGCTTTPATTILPGTVSPNHILPMNGTTVIGSGNNTIELSLDSIEVDPSTDVGNHTITIYVHARNNGTTPRQFVWFSKLTNTYGNSFGGIGISHLGNGARSAKIYPGRGELPRDYIVIRSDESFATLSKGAVLDVYIMEKTADEISMVPDYHVAWTIDPGVIR
ncbi:MAG: hypothetical protein Q7T80_03065 [Methanoregula sp.]|nr:hypothetical protein [Methanoregula sp.]